MKTIRDKLCSVIMDLEVIWENLDSFRKEMEFALPRFPFDDYLLVLLASKRIQEAIENLGRIVKETESVTSAT